MKIPPRKVLSDDCAVYVGRRIEGDKIVVQGEPYYVHKGEWVEVLPVNSLNEAIVLSKMMGTSLKNQSKLADNLSQLCEAISRRVVNWNWTDNDNKKLPSPHNRPDIIQSLTEDEIIWLATTAQGESPGERKND